MLRYERRDFKSHPDYDGHAAHCLVDQHGRLVTTTFIHREGYGTPTHSGTPATSGGGIRFLADCTDLQMLTYGLRLSKGMSEKAAALGEAVGGAKTVVRWKGEREELWEEFAKNVLPQVPGYIMAEDSGTSCKDMACISRFAPSALVAGLTSDTDPSPTTADGVILGIRVALEMLWSDPGSIGHCSYAVKGVGAVGGAIVERLWQLGVRDIHIADPNQKRLQEVRNGRDGIKIVPIDRIHAQYVDVFVPCALGGSLNKQTISELDCLVVAGCENNQLAQPEEDGVRLHDSGILYAADFVINGGGLIKVFSELIKGRSVDSMLPRIGNNLREIFERSDAQGRAPSIIAKELAAERMENSMFLPK